MDQPLVLYEDNHLLALFKPPGILVQGDRTGDPTLLESAKRYISHKYNKPGNVYIGLVHRLDRPVSGIVIFARTSKAASKLSQQIMAHQIKKIYWAIVQGKPVPPEGEWSDYIIRHGLRSFKSVPHRSKAQLAILSYQAIAYASQYTLIEINLKTGRHHQIRVQCALRGFPIVGDKKYGSKIFLPEKNIALVAKKLEFLHPTKNKKISLEAPLPDNWPSFFDNLKNRGG